uniref:IPT/TIG domain-containing protein n=1 Tax=Nocardioides sp. R-C-SC26 TaxID=2870414 RepID=UPI001E5FE379
PAGAVTVFSPTALSFPTPSATAGTVAVTVSTVGGTSDPVPGGFTYVTAPTAASLSPSSGPSAGGTSVTVTGSGFVAGATSVTVGGVAVPAGAVTVFSPTALSFPTPSATAGTVAVTVSTVGGTSDPVPGGFTYVAAPTTTSLQPFYVPVAGGILLFVRGSNFVAGATSVSIDGIVVPASEVSVYSSTLLGFMAPPHAAGPVDLSVTTPGGTSDNVPGGFIYGIDPHGFDPRLMAGADSCGPPTIASVSRPAGPSAGGQRLVVRGAGFTPDTRVRFGERAARSVSYVTPSLLRVVTPALRPGRVRISTTTIAGTSNRVIYRSLRAPELTRMTAASGPSSGGNTVVLVGRRFVDVRKVTVAGRAVAFRTVSPRRISIVMPPRRPGRVQVRVIAVGGRSATVTASSYRYR